MDGIKILLYVAAAMGGIFILITSLAYMYDMRGIKSKTVGDGQHGTARWATAKEVKDVYKHIPFEPKAAPSSKPS